MQLTWYIPQHILYLCLNRFPYSVAVAYNRVIGQSLMCILLILTIEWKNLFRGMILFILRMQMRNPQVQLIQRKVDRNFYRADQSLNKDEERMRDSAGQRSNYIQRTIQIIKNCWIIPSISTKITDLYRFTVFSSSICQFPILQARSRPLFIVVCKVARRCASFSPNS